MAEGKELWFERAGKKPFRFFIYNFEKDTFENGVEYDYQRGEYVALRKLVEGDVFIQDYNVTQVIQGKPRYIFSLDTLSPEKKLEKFNHIIALEKEMRKQMVYVPDLDVVDNMKQNLKQLLKILEEHPDYISLMDIEKYLREVHQMLFDIHKHAEAYKAFIFKGGDK
jgi:hypothetical protein